MICGPGPGFIARPIPAGVGALPVSMAIRTPIRFDAAGNPATSVGADNLPITVLAERLIEIIFRADHHLHLDHRRRYIRWRWWRVHNLRWRLDRRWWHVRDR